MATVFISHSSKDKALAKRIAEEAFAARTGTDRL